MFNLDLMQENTAITKYKHLNDFLRICRYLKQVIKFSSTNTQLNRFILNLCNYSILA